jgi:hypothetical protein
MVGFSSCPLSKARFLSRHKQLRPNRRQHWKPNALKINQNNVLQEFFDGLAHSEQTLKFDNETDFKPRQTGDAAARIPRARQKLRLLERRPRRANKGLSFKGNAICYPSLSGHDSSVVEQ